MTLQHLNNVKWPKHLVQSITLNEQVKTLAFRIIANTIGEQAASEIWQYAHPDEWNTLKEVVRWLCVEQRLSDDWQSEDAVSRALSCSDLSEVQKIANGRLIAVTPTGLIPEGPEDRQHILTLENNYRVVGLSQEAICNVTQNSNMQQPFWSGDDYRCIAVTDEDRVAALLSMKGSCLINVVVPGVRAVNPQFSEDCILPIIEHLGLEVEAPLTVPGFIRASDGKLHSFYNLPSPLHVSGDVRIYEGEYISELPDNTTIDGEFLLRNSLYIKEVPLNFRVTDRCGFGDCPGLTRIQPGFSCTGGTHLYDLTNLKTIAAGADFGAYVSLSTSLPSLDAPSFQALEVILRGTVYLSKEPVNLLFDVGDKHLKRDRLGFASLDEGRIKDAVRNHLISEITKLPAEVVKLAYQTIKLEAGRAFNRLTQRSPRKSDDDLSDERTPPKL